MKSNLILLMLAVSVVCGCSKSPIAEPAPYIVERGALPDATGREPAIAETVDNAAMKYMYWEKAEMYVSSVGLTAQWTPVVNAGDGAPTGRNTGNAIQLHSKLNKYINLRAPELPVAFLLESGLYKDMQLSIAADRPKYPGVYLPAVHIVGRMGIYDNFVHVEIDVDESVMLHCMVADIRYIQQESYFTPTLMVDLNQILYGIPAIDMMHSTTVRGTIYINSNSNEKLYSRIRGNLSRAFTAHFR